MKIIKQGEKKAWGIELVCTGAGNDRSGGTCGATLMVEENDIFRTSSGSYDGSSEYYYTFECPVCKSWTDIKDINLPSWIRDSANKRHRYPSDRNNIDTDR